MQVVSFDNLLYGDQESAVYFVWSIDILLVLPTQVDGGAA